MSNKEFNYKFYTTASEAWDAMYQAILDSQKSVYWEIYALGNDEIGDKFINLLIKKAGEGLDIKIIVDHLGSFSLSTTQQDNLRNAGVDLIVYNEVFKFQFNLYKWFKRIWQRNHRKVLIIDEETGFIGGVNVTVQEKEWGDLYLKIEGKTVRPLLRQFAHSYIKSGGKKKNVKALFHPILLKEFPSLKKKIGFIFHEPIFNRNNSKLKNFYYDLIRSARQSITLLTPYYIPDKKFLQLISEAKKRGVEINIILPYRPDHKFIQIASQAFYELSRKAGAKIFLLPRMHHGKAISVDGKFGSIGSNNFTHRSFYINKEADVNFQEKEMVAELNDILEELKKQAVPYDRKKFVDFWIIKKIKQWWAEKIKRIV
ncbi:MAG TPA: phosphatidylserine/phosphatidylglycerophosphate/cardiolipin synthase family protein [Candidatus Magasanikbacteria bacterium]|nr:phosphatidylserine/phosphatidylglycerophosphate/cardiolipin synthase family protein [Candidatus Magasanikbacteria bacterium]